MRETLTNKNAFFSDPINDEIIACYNAISENVQGLVPRGIQWHLSFGTPHIIKAVKIYCEVRFYDVYDDHCGRICCDQLDKIFVVLRNRFKAEKREVKGVALGFILDICELETVGGLLLQDKQNFGYVPVQTYKTTFYDSKTGKETDMNGNEVKND